MMNLAVVVPRDTILTATNSNHGVPGVVKLLLRGLIANSSWLHDSCAARHDKFVKFISFENLVIVLILDIE